MGLALKIILKIHINGYGLGLLQSYMENAWLGTTIKTEKRESAALVSKAKIEKYGGGGSHFLNSLVISACPPCKYTCDSGLCTHSHFREALGFLFFLHFSSGQPATF